ncbi:PD-(D/E)XK nuclease family protein [Maridesulfovibrio bastinii]|uniref:PD-(D/E)XK nuclease family protein n=1 Tax=Maridesulfovibrio bastinii TaxID=47157 RepID=UPI000417A4D3|nr:PD-(D/E)XK nuclease family protein [Maridesulfovibrio bastinii]
MNNLPITIISWKNNFIPELGKLIIEETSGELSNTVIILPHNRPARYLRKFFAETDLLPKPCILPEIISFTDFLNTILQRMNSQLPYNAGKLDQVGMLFGIIEKLRESSSGIIKLLPFERLNFFPWGIRLSSLLEELLRQGIKPDNLDMLRGEVLDWAAALLEELGTIYDEYVSELESRGWTTPGMDCLKLSENLEQTESILKGRNLYLAGFYALSGIEEMFFKFLWQNCGLKIVWHSDPALAYGKKGHFAVSEHRRWIDNWGAEVDCSQDDTDSCKLPELKFYEGFDRHSQLSELEKELLNTEHKDSGIVLPDTGLLLPVMHHLPELDVNISMGYPLERSALNGLLEAILKLQENRSDNKFFWKDITSVIRHPYLKMLDLDGEQPLRTVFHQWEAVMREGTPYTSLFDFSPVYSDGNELLVADPEKTEELRREVVHACIENFTEITTLAGLAESLQELAEMLRKRGGTLWQRYLLDSECLFRLMNEVIPELKQSSISHDIFDQNLVFSIFRQLISMQRVSFEPDPISGMQILGMLESRLLSFERTYILDAVDEKLPGTDPNDPLLPDNLRFLLDLPDSRERESVAAYNFYSLIMGSRETHIFYQCGVQPGLLDGRSMRSRFIEQLIWELEKESGAIIKPTDNFPLKAISFPVSPIHSSPEDIDKEPAYEKLQDRLKNKGLSPSAIDTYIACPKLFYYRYLSGVKEPATVNTDGDRAGFGELIHNVLKDTLLPFAGRELNPGEIAPEQVGDLFLERLKIDSLYLNLPYDAKKALEQAGRHRLEKYISSIPRTRIEAIEQDSAFKIDILNQEILIQGRIDRVDFRNDHRIIIDYKTGGLKKPGPSFWENDDIWETVDNGEINSCPEDFLEKLYNSASSLQLPLYLSMDHFSSGVIPYDAVLVELVESGIEKSLFDKKMPEEDRDTIITKKIPALTEYILKHIIESPTFTAIKSRQCDWCCYKEACGA